MEIAGGGRIGVCKSYCGASRYSPEKRRERQKIHRQSPRGGAVNFDDLTLDELRYVLTQYEHLGLLTEDGRRLLEVIA